MGNKFIHPTIHPQEQKLDKKEGVNDVLYESRFWQRAEKRVINKQDIPEIGSWAYEVYFGNLGHNKDWEFSSILIILTTMEEGEEFEISYKRLNEIADDLIAGKTNINMDY